MLDLPKDFIEEIKKMIGEDNISKYLSSLDLPINSGIVINKNKVNDNILSNILKENNYKEKYKNKYYTFKKNDDFSIGKSLYHHMGLIYVQEPSSYEVINNLDLSGEFNFIDLCASPGGKSINAILKQNKGIGILNEIDVGRCQTLKSNIERMGFINTIITNNKPSDFVKIYDDYFDLVIVDAPCSGEGMFKKSDLAIKNWSSDYVEYISCIQKEIIDSAVKLVKNNGYLIYSTCTFSKKEDEDNIDYIINKFKDFKIIKKDKIFPYNSDGEGQFYCILKKYKNKSNDYNECIIKSNDNKHIVNRVLTNFLDKYFENYSDLKGEFLLEKNKDITKVYFLNDDLCNEYKKFNSLSIKYKGLLIGEIDKNGFIPSNELAHTNIINNYIFRIEIDKNNAIRFLKGEVIDINDDIKRINQNFNFDLKEYIILTNNNIGIGIGKLVNKRIKNLYPKGLRNL